MIRHQDGDATKDKTAAAQAKRANSQRAKEGERGQILYMVLMMGMVMFATAAMTIDVGRVYIGYHELQASTDAAALAGGEAMGQPSSSVTSTDSAVSTYSSTTSDKNAYGNLPAVRTTTTLECLTTLKNNGIPCYGAGAYNAVQVQQTLTLPMTFAAIIGTPTVPLTATSTAAMAGAATTPYNVAIILDTTGSMSTTDSDCGNATRLACALNGVQTLLKELFPCASEATTCTVNSTTGVATNAVDQVALFAFPDFTAATASKATTCPTSNPTIVNAYSFPSSTLNSTTGLPNMTYTPAGKTAETMTYEVNYLAASTSYGFQSNYRASDTASTLNTSSGLAIAAGAGSCSGMGNPGGAGTYYAGVIYAAANALLAEEVNTPTAQPAIILISDGDATSTQAQMAGGSGAPGTDTGTGAINATNGGTYPSWNNECHQAITAATAAAAKGIRVYAVAYGAESSGCTTDSPSITPCTTMGDIASSPAYFYSDYKQSGSGADTSCTGTGGSGNSLTNINQIFTSIFTSFTVARLIPNSTT